MEAEKPRDSAAGRPETARAAEEPPPQSGRAKKGRSAAKVRTENILESVLHSHRLGMTVNEIILAWTC